MTVRELIERLSELPQSLDVCVRQSCGYFYDRVSDITVEKNRQDEDTVYLE